MAGDPLRIVFFGTPLFAVPSLRGLAQSRHELVGVVSQPDRPRGRGRVLAATPVKEVAQRLGRPVLQPEKVGHADATAWLRERAPDLGVVVAFGQFLPKGVRELPPHGLINAHASLLPRHRGAAPIAWAILSGDERTGVSIMRVEKEMDAGPVCSRRELEIGPAETAGELEERLSALAAEALLEALDEISAGAARFTPQAHESATFAPRIDRDFGRIDWGRPRAEVLRRIRAATPRPGADLVLRRSGRRLRVLEAGPGEGPPGPPGRVVAGRDRIRVAALDGWVDVSRLQVPGRRATSAAEYLRGARLPEDEEVGDP